MASQSGWEMILCALLCKSFCKASDSTAKQRDLHHLVGNAAGIMPVYQQGFEGRTYPVVKILTVYGELLLRAMGQTLLLALCGLFFACIIGLIVGMMSVIKNRVCRVIAAVFVDVIRGVPMIVLAYFVFFGVPYLFNTIMGIGGVTLTALQAGTICLALNCGAYMAEIIRAGIESVDRGQMEAARSLGMPYWRSMQRVVLPQAIRTMIPSIINQFIITLKDTSILSVIGFPELVNTAKNVVANTFMSFQTWAIVAVMYLIVITALSRVAKMLERRMNRGR